MSQAFQSTVWVDRPVDDVWSQLTDWSRAPEWMPGVDAATASGATAVGTILTVHSRGKDRANRITAVEPGRSVTISSARGGVRVDYTYTCEPDGEGTRVGLVADVGTSGFPWRLLGGMIRSAIRRADGGQLAAFKRVVEARGRRA